MHDITNQILVFDPQIAGVSGDMMVGALLDLGADITKVTEAMKIPEYCIDGCKKLEIDVSDITKKGIRAKKVDIKIEEETDHCSGSDLQELMSRCLQRLDISEKAKEFASQAIETIITAEAHVHSQSIQDVHLHETASADTLADIIGSAVALDDLGLFDNTQIYSTPVAVGGGTLKFSHGTVSSPAPATHEILRSSGLLMIGGPVEAELSTPTGVSLLCALSPESVRFYPPMKSTRIGYGAGTKEFTDMPNVLKVTLGEPHSYSLLEDNVYAIETNLDDVTGEVIGYTIEKLLQEGALDVSAIPMFTKKSRPGYTLRVLANPADLERLCSILIKETGTLGVRTYKCERRILDREILTVEVPIENTNESINVKVAKNAQGKIVHIKPEYEDIKRVAEKTGLPLREIELIVREKASKLLK